MKTTSMLTREEALASRRWFLIDAREQVLGRVATEAAKILRGKGRPAFTPHVDCGDFVVVVNARHVRLTGGKEKSKVYHRHTGYPGGIRSRSAEDLRGRHPERLIRVAVTGMLPKNRLGRRLASKLKVYAEAEHPHASQQPKPIEIASNRARRN
jgi:large subunit ribosomal protein L13